tara:strand:- start:20 stop:139 length:120 start_codon:yes stop_codon:yes gene_type:complete
MTSRKKLKQIRRKNALRKYKNIQKAIAKYKDSPKRKMIK